MVPCPSCGHIAFTDGQCRACGYAPPPPVPLAAADLVVVTGTPLSQDELQELPPMLEDEAISVLEVEAERVDAPLMEGFEPTRLDDGPLATPAVRGADRAPEPASFAYSQCPRCGEAQAAPTPMFCDGCGFKLRYKPKGAGVVDTRKCRECGVTNPIHKTNCTNCGQRMPS